MTHPVATATQRHTLLSSNVRFQQLVEKVAEGGEMYIYGNH